MGMEQTAHHFSPPFNYYNYYFSNMSRALWVDELDVISFGLSEDHHHHDGSEQQIATTTTSNVLLPDSNYMYEMAISSGNNPASFKPIIPSEEDDEESYSREDGLEDAVDCDYGDCEPYDWYESSDSYICYCDKRHACHCRYRF
ncbi:hypothetical protein C9374_012194 [Naegleria lovaniensis]|uniref:Uncharacterized protein n=1 Tax=Naegleria lovaniensis TaxID=51637 RepID=A0AA88GD86_NAELO|nr:uncharacterized protein C9374_012194 [Naegleria lovaniensis]KAG2373328.1 hypothetical protein C9374_012194 [Naegleria lovaniensis]